MSAFLGMRGNGDWVTDQRPKNWRETILFLYPNGSMPLTAIMSKMKSEKTDDPQFYWWTKLLPTQAGTVTGVYTDAALLVAYASGATAGSNLYLKMAAADIIHFRVGHTVLMRDASDFTTDVVGKVISVATNGAASNIGVKLLEADDNSSYGHDLSDCDKVMVIGSVNAEGAAMPTGISYDPDKLYNYTQIFRTPLSITRTARKTKLRTGDAYKEMKREALELHGIEMEKAFLFGVPYEGTGDNGKPERTTEGLITLLRSQNASNVTDFQLNATYHGKGWLDDGGGDAFLSTYLEQVFRYGRQEKLAICGTGALLGINRLAQAGSHYQMTATTKAYGINVTEWITPMGKIYLKTHPLFNIESSLRNSMLIFEPENCVYRYIDDTNFYGEGDAKQAAPGTNGGRIDGSQEEFLTECGLEYHHPYTAAFLNGVGLDHSA
jgi:hypothetical protein